MSSFKQSILFTCFLFTHPLLAASLTWQGGTAENAFEANANWMGNAAPASGAGDSLTFPANPISKEVVMNSAFVMTCQGNGLILKGDSYSFTSAGMIWGNDQSTPPAIFQVQTGVNNEFKAPITIAESGIFQINTAQGTSIEFSGGISDNDPATLGQMILSGSGTVILSRVQPIPPPNPKLANSYHAQTKLQGGTLLAGDGGISPNSPLIFMGNYQTTTDQTLDLAGNFSVQPGFLQTWPESDRGYGTVTNSTAGSISSLDIVGIEANIPNTFFGSIRDGSGIVGVGLGEGVTFQLSNTPSRNASNTYSGFTAINNGATLQAVSVNAFSPNSEIAFLSTTPNGSGTLDLNGYDNTIALLSSKSTSTSAVVTNTNPNGVSAILTIAGTGTSEISGTSTTTYSGTIVDNPNNSHCTIGLTLSNSGYPQSPTPKTLQLSNSGNTYSGDTTINAGAILQATATSALSPNSPVVLNGGTLDLNGFAYTPTSLNDGADPAAILLSTVKLSSTTNPGTLTINAPTTYSGTVQLCSSASIGTLTINTTSNFYGNIIDGDGTNVGGTLIKTGSGLLTLAGMNTYSGATTLSGGIILAESNGAFSPNSAFTLSDGTTLNLSNFSNTIGSLTGSSGSIVTGGSGTGPTVLTISNGGTTYAGQIKDNLNGHLGIIKNGSLTLTLTGTSNTYSGLTTINGGSLTAGANNVFSQNSTVILEGGILDLNNYNNTVLSLAGISTTSIVQSSTGAATLTLSYATSGDTVYAGTIIDGTGPLTLTKNGSPALMLTGTSNTYSGTTTISGGSLKAGATNAFSPSSAVVVNAGGTLDLNGFANAIPNFSGAGTVSLSSKAAAGSLTVGSNNLDATFSGVIKNGGTETVGGNLIKVGTGTLSLSGNNTYTGTTTVNEGTLLLTSTGSIMSGSDLSVSGTIGLGIFDISQISDPFFIAGNLSGANTGRIYLGDKKFTAGGATSTTTFHGILLDGNSSGGGSTGAMFLKSGSGELILAGVNSYTGGTSIIEGILTLSPTGTIETGTDLTVIGTFNIDQMGDPAYTVRNLSGASTGVINIGNKQFTAGGSDDKTYSGKINGSGGTFTKAGSGTLTLAGNNTYSGQTTINEGILALSSTGKLAAGNDLTVAGTFDISQMTAPSFTVGNLSGESTGVVNLGSKQFTAGGSTDKTYSGTINGAGATFTKTGSAMLTLAGNNTYTGSTSINSGTLALASTGTIVEGKDLSVSGTFDISQIAAATFRVGNLSGANTGIINLGSKEFIAGGSANTIFAGSLSDSGILVSTGATFTKAGTGKLTLSGDNSYSGITTVSAGELAVLGNIGLALFPSQVTVNAGATLSGTGTITSDVTITGAVENNGICSPGSSLATSHLLSLGAVGPALNITGNYSQDEHSMFDIEINPTSSDQLIVTGAVTITSTNTKFNVIPLAGSYTIPSEYTVITGASVTGTFAHFTSLPLVKDSLIYTPTSVTFKLGVFNPIAQYTFTGNAEAVALAIDTVYNSGSAALNQILGTLVSHPSATAIDEAMDAMHPALFKGAALAQQNNSVLVRSALTQRMQTVLDRQSCPAISKENEQNFHVWLSGVGDYLHQGGLTFFNSPQIGYQDDTSGLVGGFDYHFYNNFYIGALGAYTHSNVKWEQNQGKADIDSGYAGLYLSALGELFYGNLSVVGAVSNYDEERNIIYTNVFKTADNSHHGQQLISHFDTGLNLQFNRFVGLTLRPFDSLDWIVQKENGFTEQGAGQWDLKVKNSFANMLRNELGFNLAASHCTAKAKLTLDTKLSWVKELRLSGRSYQAAFIAADAVPFTVNGYFPNRSLIATGISLSAVAFKERLTCTLYYNSAFGKSYSENSIGGQVNCGF